MVFSVLTKRNKIKYMSRQYPTAEYLHQCFLYKKGKLFWKMRPVFHFSDKAHCDMSNTRYAGKEAGSLHNSRHKSWDIKIQGTMRSRAQITWAMHHGFWPPQQIDHKNRISTDDRIENLRIATTQQNAANRGKRSDNTSGYKGVTRRSGKWIAQIEFKGKNHILGKFLNPKEAHEAYLKAATSLHGEYATG